MSGTDLQVVNGGAMASYEPRANTGLMPVYDIESAIARRNAIVEFTKAVMVEGQDYGKIPGTDKDTLLKPGAEKLASLFGLSCRPVIVEKEEDWTGERHGGEPFFNYLYRCQLWRGEMLVAEADGSCNSWESKYRWRNAERVCPQCGKPAIIVGKPEYGGGFVCFKRKGGCGATFPDTDPAITGQQVGRVPNPDIFAIVNTLQKMAQKRALVAVTLLAVNASEFFTQDVEDMGYIDAPYRSEAVPVAQPTVQPAAQGTERDVVWVQARVQVIERVKSLPEDRQGQWVGEIARRFGSTKMGNASLQELEDLYFEIERVERELANGQADTTTASPTAPVEPISALPAAKKDTSEKQQLRVKIDHLKADLWPNPETRPGHYQEFLQAHFNMTDTARADKDALQIIANALQGRINARQAVIDAKTDEDDDPFDGPPATVDPRLDLGGDA